MKKSLIIFLVFVFLIPIFAQTKTNLEKVYQLIDNSIIKIASQTKSNSEITLSIVGPSYIDLLKPKIFESFSKNGFIVKNANSGNSSQVHYALNQTSIEYGEAEKDGFFGSLVCERNVSIKGIFTFALKDGSVNSSEFKEEIKDTIKVDEIKYIEDSGFPYTQGIKPEVSFFDNLLEPVLVVATLVTTVILLFSIRGK